MRFDFTATVKKQKRQSQSIKINIYEVVEKNVCCVAGINFDGLYHAVNISTGEHYVITSKSYRLKTKTYYAQQLISNKRLQVSTLKTIKEFNRPWLYLPFAPGVGLIGNVVKTKYLKDTVIMFDLQRTFDMPKEHPLSRSEFLYFRDNYSDIYNNILKRYGRESV